MINPQTSRREMLKSVSMASAALMLGSRSSHSAEASKLHLSTNQYSWFVYYQREKKDFAADWDTGFADVAASGMNAFEATVTDPAAIGLIAPLLKKHNLQLRSIYVNSSLHEAAEAEKSIEQILAIAQKAKEAGTKIIVTNPNPIQWGGEQNKSDAQLEIQAAALNTLGQKLAALGLTLSYHNHDPELRNAAREFHHMMLGTDPKNLTLCLDAHWIYRGSGNSQVALFDVVKLYGPRITEVHLRQSQNGVWSESFGEGDIDYARLAQALLDAGVKPHLVMEQACETGTPHTMDPVELHKKSAEYARRIFKDFA